MGTFSTLDYIPSWNDDRFHRSSTFDGIEQMIVVKVELHSISGTVKELSRMVISRDLTSSGKLRNYTARIIRKTKNIEQQMIRTMMKKSDPVRTCRVEDYPSDNRPIWDLVSLSLKGMGYAEKNF